MIQAFTEKIRHRGQVWLLQLAGWMMTHGFEKRAFRLLNRLKAGRVRLAGVDLPRARYRLQKEAPGEAVEMLKEELRWHPGNVEAQELLQTILKKEVPAPSEPMPDGHGEFAKIFRVAREYTMLGPLRLLKLYQQAERVMAQGIPGNFVECGVAAGGSSALLAAVLHQEVSSGRKLFSFDTFEGMPSPGPEDVHCGMEAQKTGWGTGTCAAPLDSLRSAATALGCWERIVPVPGLFSKTLPKEKSRIGPIALLHMDGDWYSSTKDILENLYDQLSPGAYIQVDDYGHWDGCKKAIDEFFQKKKISPKLERIDAVGVAFWKESGA